MDNIIARSLLRLIMDAQGPERTATRLAEVLDERGFRDDKVTGIFETGEANAFKEERTK